MSEDLIKRSDALKVLSLYGWTPIDGLYDTFAHDIPPADQPMRNVIALVNRESMREDLSEEILRYLFFDLRHKLWDMAVNDLPQGKWIAFKGANPPEFHGKHYCSNCNHALHLGSTGGAYNYCPNCGAEMEGVDE